jgi:hypothetical protein
MRIAYIVIQIAFGATIGYLDGYYEWKDLKMQADAEKKRSEGKIK